MPSTPAWPPKSLVRLYLDQPLGVGMSVALDPAQANYLGNVMRKSVGDELLVFDGRSGEWLATVADAGKKRMTVSIDRRTREPEALPDLILAFAPVKRAQTDWLVEKATELGIAVLQPVMTHRTIADRVKLDRLATIAIEAAEQCHRTTLPTVAPPITLAAFLDHLGQDRTLYFADEKGGAPAATAMTAGPAALLVGPEGGFTDDERATIRAHRHAVPISLGPRILRAETAALAAIAVYMAMAGDWADKDS